MGYGRRLKEATPGAGPRRAPSICLSVERCRAVGVHLLSHRREAQMKAKTIQSVAAVAFSVASFGFLFETMAEKDGPVAEIIVAAVMASSAVAWLGWEFVVKLRSQV